jgi:beta-lactam-binding protein with PASTA domain
LWRSIIEEDAVSERRRRRGLGWVVLVGALLLFLVPSGTAFAASTHGSTSSVSSLEADGVVPDVTGWDANPAIAAVEAAGFVAQTSPGFVDCGPPYVQRQTPVGGTSAPLGSTVTLKINRQPGPGQQCP